MNILVTGGAGYIGSHACKALHTAGYKPVVLDNMMFGHEDFVRWGPLIRGDIRDVDLVAGVLSEYGIDAVMHFAALAYVGESVLEPEKYYDTNVIGTLRLLEAMRKSSCNKIIFSSTCAIYGESEGVLVTEESKANPLNPYGRSKLFCEYILEDFSSSSELAFVVLRYFNAAGDDPDGEVGENRSVETHLIPRAMMALNGHLDDFQVFGADYPTPDGTAIRDYIHVSDLAEAHVLSLGRLFESGKRINKFNLGTGCGYSVREILSEIEKVSGRQLPQVLGSRRPGDPARLVADGGLARRELNFQPRYSNIETIVETAWRWHSKIHPNISDRLASAR